MLRDKVPWAKKNQLLYGVYLWCGFLSECACVQGIRSMAHVMPEIETHRSRPQSFNLNTFMLMGETCFQK